MRSDSFFNATDPHRRALILASGLLAGGAMLPRPAAAAAPAAGFDFLHGRWRVTHRKLRKRLAGSSDWFAFPGTLDVQPILGGAGNFDRNVLDDPAGRYEASSLRLFDRGNGRWSIWWLDGRAPAVEPPVVGEFTGRKGTFYADDQFAGRPIRVRTTYEPLDATRARWTQAFSADARSSWEVNWIMDFERNRA